MLKHTVKQMILNELDNKPKGYAEELAAIGGYSSASALRKVLRDENKEFEKFIGLIKIIRELFPLEEVEILSSFALTLDFNKQTARFMLEYLDINAKFDTKKELIKCMLNGSNKDSLEWANLYHNDDLYLNGELTSEEALTIFRQTSSKTKSIEIEIISTIFSAYVYLDDKLYDYSFQIVKSLLDKVELVKEKYIRDLFKARILRLHAEFYVRNGDLNKGRQCSYEVINTIDDNNSKAWCALQVANSFIIQDYEKANNFLTLGLGLTNINERVLVNLKRSKNFLDNLWGKTPQFLNLNSDNVSDRHEIAFSLINQGEHQKALEILNKDLDEQVSFNTLAFHYYLKGMITNSMNDYIESIRNFRKSGDVLFRQLPLIKLKNFGIDEHIIGLLAE